MKKKLLILLAVFGMFNLISKTANAQAPYPISVFDSLSVYCSLPATVYFYTSGYNAGPFLSTDSITMDVSFGDGTNSSTRMPLYQGGSYYYGNVAHVFTLPGQYTLQFKVTWPNSTVDSILYGPITVGPCGNIEGTAFIDDNADCTLNVGETILPYASILASDVSGNTYTYAYADSAGHYSIDLPIGANYNLTINSSFLNAATISCPAGGSYAVVPSGSNQTLDFGISCSSQFDLEVNLTGWRFRPGFTGWVTTWVRNNSCFPAINAGATLTLDPLVSYSADHWGVPSSNVSGQYVSWNNIVTNFWGNNHTASTEIFTPLTAQIGDSVCFTYNATPTLNDANTNNNTVTNCYPVSNSWDPNAKEVSPQGHGAEGFVPQNTNFTYTIHFQNTGTDTAYNVSVVDTIDADLDFSSLVIVGSSHQMTIDVIDNHIVKFNFYNIMLPDSGTNLLGSEGYIIYKVKAKPFANVGTEYKNTAYIYFDFNEAVVTNTTLNTIEIITGAEEAAKNTFSLAPNPANDNVIVNFNNNFSGQLMITDIAGRVVKQINVNNNDKVSISTAELSNGFYQLSTLGNASVVSKLQVIH
jgi:fimbrial isopeptide formation D2 family protein